MSDSDNVAGKSAYDPAGLGKFSGDETIVVGAVQTGKELARHVSEPSRGPGGPSRSGIGPKLPTLFVLSGGGVTKYPIRPNVYILTIGNSREESTITLRDPSLSGKQLVILKIGGEWIFLDCGIKDVVRFNGIVKRQHVAPINCRLTIQVGSQFMIFASDFDASLETATVRLKKKLLLSDVFEFQDLTDGKLVVKFQEQEYTSVKRPILIGSEETCDIRMSGRDIAPFHAQIFWHHDGLFLQPLGTRDVGLDGTLVGDEARLGENAKITIAEDTLEVRFVGDCAQRCADLFPEVPGRLENFSLTALANSEANSVNLQHFTLGHPIMIGRSGECDVVLNDTAVSRQHAQLIPSSKSFILIDNYSANGTYVNGEKITKMRVRAGDVVEIGNSYFLVHYA